MAATWSASLQAYRTWLQRGRRACRHIGHGCNVGSEPGGHVGHRSSRVGRACPACGTWQQGGRRACRPCRTCVQRGRRACRPCRDGTANLAREPAALSVTARSRRMFRGRESKSQVQLMAATPVVGVGLNEPVSDGEPKKVLMRTRPIAPPPPPIGQTQQSWVVSGLRAGGA